MFCVTAEVWLHQSLLVPQCTLGQCLIFYYLITVACPTVQWCWLVPFIVKIHELSHVNSVGESASFLPEMGSPKSCLITILEGSLHHLSLHPYPDNPMFQDHQSRMRESNYCGGHLYSVFFLVGKKHKCNLNFSSCNYIIKIMIIFVLYMIIIDIISELW